MDARKALLDKTVRFELLAREAVRRGYDKNDTVAFAVKQNAVQTMIRQEFDEKNTAEMVPAEDVKKYYDAHIDEFVRPELRRASQVLVATEADATRLLPETKSADMRTFRELARNKSLDQESKLRGGDLRYFDAKGRVFDETAAAVDPVLAATTFALKDVGDTSEPLKVERGYAILKLTGQRAAHEETLADASETIRSRLWRERRQAGIDALLDGLRAQYKPEIHPELVDAIRFDSSAALPSTTKPVAKPAAAAH
jgi:peptidyl-prolyl cis-trans isomerase C